MIAESIEDAIVFDRARIRAHIDPRAARALLAFLREFAESPEQLWRIACAANAQRQEGEAHIRRYNERRARRPR